MPEGGRANRAVLALLARALGVPASALSLLSGGAGRDKRVRITGDPAALGRALAACAQNR